MLTLKRNYCIMHIVQQYNEINKTGIITGAGEK